MVLGVEDERDGVADGSIYTRGAESKATATDLHLDGCRRDGRGESGEDGGGEGEMHFDYLFGGVFRLDDPEGVDDNLV
jgi:hypothetical protein